MASNKPVGLSTVVDSAPVIESEGDIFMPLRLLYARYKFAALRFDNLLYGRRAVLETAEADEKPALEKQCAELGRTFQHYSDAARNIGLLIPSRFEALANEAEFPALGTVVQSTEA